jgi:hypothetical protein
MPTQYQSMTKRIEAFLDYVSDPNSKMSNGKPLKKTTSVLRREDCCCFLGALCEFAVINEITAPAQEADNGRYAYSGGEHFPPVEVTKWIGFDFENLRITPNKVTLITANDCEEMSFKDIADAIRVELKKNAEESV